MSLKLKALGLGFIAALAVSAVVVVNATAETGGHFVSTENHTILAGEDAVVTGGHLVDNNGLTVSCHVAKYHGTTTTATSESVTINPTYEKCERDGLVMHVDMNGCAYTFTIGKNPTTVKQTVHLVCPAGKSVTLTTTGPFGTCTIHIAPQTPTGGVTFHNVGTPHHITATVTVTGIKLTRTGGFFLCGSSEEAGTAELTTNVTLKGFSTAGGQVGITATG